MRLFLFTFLYTFLSGPISFAYEIGKPIASGKGCVTTTTPVTQSKSEQTLEIPLQIHIKKTTSRLIERETCNVRVPISVGPKEKIIVKEIDQDLGYDTTGKARAYYHFEVFLQSGSTRMNLEQKIEGSGNQDKQTLTILDSINSKCGEEAMLSINTSGRIEGVGTGKLFTQPVKLVITSDTCL